MNVSTPMPSTIQFRPSRLVGLMTIVAALAAAITCVLLVFAVDRGTEQAPATSADVLSSLSANEREYVEGIAALTPEELAAGYGRVLVDPLSSLSPQEFEYVEGIAAMTPEELAAAFGTENVDPPLDYSFYSAE